MEAWRRTILKAEATIGEALQCLEETGMGVVLVADEEGRLLGLATDGDLRRALLSGHTLSAPVAEVMNRAPVVARSDESPEQVLTSMSDSIRHVPQVDDEGHVCGLVLFSELYRKVPWAIPYIGLEELHEVSDAVKTNWVTMGPKVQRFERQVAEYVGRHHAIAVNSGTAALDVALKALGIGPGDEVIVPAFTYIATVNAVMYQHATPVLADVDPVTFNLDPNDVAARITLRTKAIMCIDYGGQAADYPALERVARTHGVALIEDGAQSLGAQIDGRPLCSFGVVSTTSFHAAKVITAAEGGMVLTDDDDLAWRARVIRNQGEHPRRKYLHVLLGHNYRMSDLHAAVGLAQFAKLDEVLRRRAWLASLYTEHLADLPDVTLPQVRPGNRHAWFFYPILMPHRDAVVEALAKVGIDTRVAWPLAVHHQPLYERQFYGQRFPVAERVAQAVLNLPMYYAMTEAEVKYVVMHLRDALLAQRRPSWTGAARASS